MDVCCCPIVLLLAVVGCGAKQEWLMERKDIKALDAKHTRYFKTKGAKGVWIGERCVLAAKSHECNE